MIIIPSISDHQPSTINRRSLLVLFLYLSQIGNSRNPQISSLGNPLAQFPNHLTLAPPFSLPLSLLYSFSDTARH